ncbi:unnamed protein product [Dovyalis caffra]|uniref:Uncharacterized protein n=1 Tax=Dovyalis caffra TaxID=77055 RepID=A0AAV1QZH9_9ROSI|nr:unnamed protein product [Dovyalis caffra]
MASDGERGRLLVVQEKRLSVGNGGLMAMVVLKKEMAIVEWNERHVCPLPALLALGDIYKARTHFTLLVTSASLLLLKNPFTSSQSNRQTHLPSLSSADFTFSL